MITCDFLKELAEHLYGRGHIDTADHYRLLTVAQLVGKLSGDIATDDEAHAAENECFDNGFADGWQDGWTRGYRAAAGPESAIPEPPPPEI